MMCIHRALEYCKGDLGLGSEDILSLGHILQAIVLVLSIYFAASCGLFQPYAKE